MSSRRHRTTSSERSVWIDRYQRSGLTQQAFAQQHQLGLSTFQKWLREARSCSSPAAMQWQQVTLSAPAPTGQARWAAEMVRRDGVTLRLAHDAPVELVRALWRLPC